MGDIIREEEEALLDSSLLAETPSITLNRLSQVSLLAAVDVDLLR
jgi:hypothetical protein